MYLCMNACIYIYCMHVCTHICMCMPRLVITRVIVYRENRIDQCMHNVYQRRMRCFHFINSEL